MVAIYIEISPNGVDIIHFHQIIMERRKICWKVAPFLAHPVVCRLKITLSDLQDGDTYITEYNKKSSGSSDEPLAELFFSPSPEVKKSRLKRYNVDYESQETYESEKLWMGVSDAIRDANQVGELDR